ncbi:hypothetical protein AB6A40_001417 [Gnathostoma spinigerum]|uniref:SPT2 homolog N-terminal domain-containing protein n=1 Tax=Gnathostoma spinigerum TaxID=75299 RepID=A0ABD6E438_9BILA
MDTFDEILRLASGNKAEAKKKVKEIDQTTSKVKFERIKQLEAVRKAAKNEPTKKQISASVPNTSKKKTEETVDKSRIASFLRKKEEEKRRQEQEKIRQKENLIQKRLEAHGGKATKRMAKAFGTSPLELQRKYGHDAAHEEYLKRLELREEEEMERLNMEFRGTVAKAIERKKKVDEKIDTSQKSQKPHRMAITKKNSMRYLTKEDSPEPTASGSSLKKPPPAVPKKRAPPPASAVNFDLLMKKAEAIQKGEPPPRSPSPPQKSVEAQRNKYSIGTIKKSNSGSLKSSDKFIASSTKGDTSARKPSLSASRTMTMTVPAARNASSKKDLAEPPSSKYRGNGVGEMRKSLPKNSYPPPSSPSRALKQQKHVDCSSSNKSNSAFQKNIIREKNSNAESSSSTRNFQSGIQNSSGPPRRYLPGDLRYQKSNCQSQPSLPMSAKSSTVIRNEPLRRDRPSERDNFRKYLFST